MHPTLDRVGNRAKRELVARFAPASRLASSRHAAALRRHHDQLPALDDHHAALLGSLQDDGVVVGSWGDLHASGTAELEPVLTGLAETLAARPARPEGTDSSIRLGRDEMLEDPRLFRWGLQDGLLDLVENYLGVPAHYYGPLVHRELADARVVSTRQWHRDVEDRRMLKVLVYLDDVDADGGPFTYVPREASQAAARTLRYVGGFVGDDRFAATVPATQWRPAVGPRWTAAMPDTAAIFHRAQPPVSRDRYSVTFTWMSRSPVKVIPAEPWGADQARRAAGDLTARQRAALPPAMGLG